MNKFFSLFCTKTYFQDSSCQFFWFTAISINITHWTNPNPKPKPNPDSNPKPNTHPKPNPNPKPNTDPYPKFETMTETRQKTQLFWVLFSMSTKVVTVKLKQDISAGKGLSTNFHQASCHFC